MKKIFGSFIIIVAVGLMGCSNDKKNNDTLTRQGNGRGGNQGGPTSQTGAGNPGTQNGGVNGINQNPGLWGLITPKPSIINWGNSPMGNTPQLDNDVVRMFLSTNLDPGSVGATTNSQDPNYNLPCRQGQRCMVVMNMPLTVATQTLTQAMSTQSQVAITSGTITIIVYDSLVGATANDQTIITPFPIYLNLDPNVQSYVNGHTMVAQFADSLGTITVAATITNGQMVGTISFNNFNSVNANYPNTGASGQLGQVQINTCSVFTQQCQ